MSSLTVEDRLSRIEKLVDELVQKSIGGEPPKDWRHTVGMFDGDPIMREIIEEGRRIRELDREQTRT